MTKVKKVGILSFAKLQAVLLALVGLIAGIIYSFGGVIYDLVTTGSVNRGTALAFLALLGMPVTFAAFGYTLGFVEAFLYNSFAGSFDGLKFDIEQ